MLHLIIYSYIRLQILYPKTPNWFRNTRKMTKTANGISLLFDQKKLLNLIKTIGSLKGNSTLSALGTIANNYDGMRVGFEMTK